MNIILLQAKYGKVDVTSQQKHIFRYAHQNNLNIDSTEIDSFDINEDLSSRNELKGFLRSLDIGDNILIYSLSTFSYNVEELVKILNCLFERSISAHVTSLDLKITRDTPIGMIFGLLLKEQEKNYLSHKTSTHGRPKGRMSKSKFDIHRLKIIELLEKKHSVNEISKILGISRSSLKDYINSRGLKDLVETRKTLLREKDFVKNKKFSTKCKIIKK